MRFVILLVAIASASFLAQQVLPWWSVIIVAGVAGAALNAGGRVSFWAGFLGVALLWGGFAAYQDALNEGILSARMGELMGGASGKTLILMTALFGGLFGGLSAWTGNMARSFRR